MRLTTRLKKSKAMIRLVRPTELTSSNLIYPIFIREDGKGFEIPSMKGQRYCSLDDRARIRNEVVGLGIPAVPQSVEVTPELKRSLIGVNANKQHVKEICEEIVSWFKMYHGYKVKFLCNHFRKFFGVH